MTDYAWSYWTDSSTTSSTANTWNYWTTGSMATTLSMTSSTTWGDWNIVSASVAYRPQPLTPEQQQAAQERAEAYRVEQDRARQAAEDARQKAQELLESCLTTRQRKTLRKQRFFDVRAIGPDGQETVYRIEQGSHGNVYEVDAEGRKVRRFCIQPDGVPAGDSMLAQKLMLETDPAAFERIANITPLRRAV